MRIMIKQDSDVWSVDDFSRSVMCPCCDCNSSCHGSTARENPLKAKMPRSWKRACRFANIMQTFWSTELARTGKEPKHGRNLSCNFYVCMSSPHQYQRLLVHTGSVSHLWDKSNCFQSHTICLALTWPHVTLTILSKAILRKTLKKKRIWVCFKLGHPKFVHFCRLTCG